MKENIKHIIWIAGFAVIVEAGFLLNQQRKLEALEEMSEPSVDYWQLFSKISKERKFIEEVGAHYRVPVFTQELLDLSSQVITLSGYFLPYSRLDSVIILSRYPNASCFYCGMAGIESVAMVEVNNGETRYVTDQRLTVRGRLSLNSTNVNKLAFVIEEALVEESRK